MLGGDGQKEKRVRHLTRWPWEWDGSSQAPRSPSIHSLNNYWTLEDLVSTQDIDEPDAVLASGLPQIMSKSKWEWICVLVASATASKSQWVPGVWSGFWVKEWMKRKFEGSAGLQELVVALNLPDSVERWFRERKLQNREGGWEQLAPSTNPCLAVSTLLGACRHLRDVGGASRAGSLWASGQGVYTHLHVKYIHKLTLTYRFKQKKPLMQTTSLNWILSYTNADELANSSSKGQW